MSKRGIAVFQAQGEMEAQQICAFLGSHGVSATMLGEALRKTHGLVLDGLGAVSIIVPEGDAHRAGLLLDQARRGELSLDEDMETDPEGLGDRRPPRGAAQEEPG